MRGRNATSPPSAQPRLSSARELTGRGEQRELFEADSGPAQPVAVRLDRVRVERGRAFGAVWLAWQLWEALRLEQLCAERLPAGREAVAWAQMAAIAVIARLCEPASELHIKGVRGVQGDAAEPRLCPNCACTCERHLDRMPGGTGPGMG